LLQLRAIKAIFFVDAPLVVSTASSTTAERPADHLDPTDKKESA